MSIFRKIINWIRQHFQKNKFYEKPNTFTIDYNEIDSLSKQCKTELEKLKISVEDNNQQKKTFFKRLINFIVRRYKNHIIEKKKNAILSEYFTTIALSLKYKPSDEGDDINEKERKAFNKIFVKILLNNYTYSMKLRKIFGTEEIFIKSKLDTAFIYPTSLAVQIYPPQQDLSLIQDMVKHRNEMIKKRHNLLSSVGIFASLDDKKIPFDGYYFFCKNGSQFNLYVQNERNSTIEIIPKDLGVIKTGKYKFDEKRKKGYENNKKTIEKDPRLKYIDAFNKKITYKLNDFIKLKDECINEVDLRFHSSVIDIIEGYFDTKKIAEYNEFYSHFQSDFDDKYKNTESIKSLNKELNALKNTLSSGIEKLANKKVKDIQQDAEAALGVGNEIDKVDKATLQKFNDALETLIKESSNLHNDHYNNKKDKSIKKIIDDPIIEPQHKTQNTIKK